jgi:hypothetical protein
MCAAALVFAAPAAAMEDVYETGAASEKWLEPTTEASEFYRKRIEGLGPFGHHIAPAYAGGRELSFWERVDAEAPTPSFVLWSLVRAPKHVLWNTPINMGVNLKRNYWDTFSQSESGLGIASDLVFGLPNTLMVGVNGVYDAATNLYADVYQPVLGAVVLWPPRLLTGLLEEPAPGVYVVVDALPKTLWSVLLPVRKVVVTVTDQGQKGLNFSYRTLTHPLHIGDHAERYWGENGLSSGD